jgi:hypothetical protein
VDGIRFHNRQLLAAAIYCVEFSLKVEVFETISKELGSFLNVGLKPGWLIIIAAEKS